MITIARSQGGAPRLSDLLASAPSALTIPWAMSSDAPTPWAGFRRIVAGARARLGNDAVEAALTSEADLVHLVFRRLAASDPSPARLHGGLAQRGRPNVVARARPLRSALVRVLTTLLAGRDVTIAVPELDDADLESLSALRPLLGALSGRANVRVIVGYDESKIPRGEHATFIRELRRKELRRYEALGTTSVTTVPPEEAPLRGLPAWDPRDDQLEVRAYASARSGAPGWEALTLDAMRAAFDSFGFDAAFRFASALARTVTDERLRREVHLTAAIACQNLEPLAAGPGWLRDTLDAHFAAALDGEPDPLARAHVLYRQAILAARAHRNPEAASALAREASAIASSARVEHAGAAYYESWAHNAHAYALLRAARTQDAAVACEEGYACIQRADLDAVIGEAEVELTRSLLSNNRAKLASLAGDADALAHWRARAEAHYAALSRDDRPPPAWLTPPEDNLSLVDSLRHHTRTLEQARREWNPDVEALAAHAVALTRFRLGDAIGARECFATALRIWQALGAEQEDLATQHLNCAVASYFAGDIEAAERGFRALLANDQFAGVDAQAEIEGALAMVAAKRGAADEARQRAVVALRKAEQAGDGSVRIRVTRCAGEVELLLNAHESAARHFQSAYALLPDADAAPEDELGILVGLLDAGAGSPSIVERALGIAVHALSDPNAWWDVPRLLRHADALEPAPNGVDVQYLRAAAAQLPLTDPSPSLTATRARPR